MRTIAYVFCYNRVQVLQQCITSLFEASKFIPDTVIFIDDGSTEPVEQLLDQAYDTYSSAAEIGVWIKDKNEGLSDSARYAFFHATASKPDYVFLIEGDYIFRQRGLDDLMDLFLYTSQGNACLGVSGYDHPNFYNQYMTETVFPTCMVQQVGEDNVCRDVLHKPFYDSTLQYGIELVSNTCWTSYLNWRKIREVAEEFPGLDDLLDQAVSPRENPNYPDSGKYKEARVVDDGMLSHALSLYWNKWAIKHKRDREHHAAWLNIKPSIAQHVLTGGMHT